jgi:hypothetical protein
MLGIHDISVQIRIRLQIPGSVPLTNGSDSFLSDFKDAKKIIFSITYPQAHYL